MRSRWLFCLTGLATLAMAEITISVSDVESYPLQTEGSVSSLDGLFRQSCPEELSPDNPYTPEILMSSYTDSGVSVDEKNRFPAGKIFPSSDGLVRGALEAWAQHQHLVLRPEEVWFEILVQLNFYMSAHASELRDLFVSHEGKKEIKVADLSWRSVVSAFGNEMQKRVRTEWLLEWIMPGFSTSTENDGLTATVLMTGLMQHYFEFSGMVVCGLPKVTLLGERGDWVRLVDKLERLKEFGKEPAAYARNLRPILAKFVETWDEAESEKVKDFWKQIARARKVFSCGTGASEYEVSGWITGFLHWKKDGSLRVTADDCYDDEDDDEGEHERGEEEEEEEEAVFSAEPAAFEDMSYVPSALEDIPVGYAKAPLKMVDYPVQGTNTQAYLLAGNIGVERTLDEGEVKARPLSGWILYAPVDWNVTAGPCWGDGMELEHVAEVMEMCRGLVREEEL